MTSGAFAQTPAPWSIHQSCCVMVHVVKLEKRAGWKDLIQEVPMKGWEVRPLSTQTWSFLFRGGIGHIVLFSIYHRSCILYPDSNWWGVNVLQGGHRLWHENKHDGIQRLLTWKKSPVPWVQEGLFCLDIQNCKMPWPVVEYFYNIVLYIFMIEKTMRYCSIFLRLCWLFLVNGLQIL